MSQSNSLSFALITDMASNLQAVLNRQLMEKPTAELSIDELEKILAARKWQATIKDANRQVQLLNTCMGPAAGIWAVSTTHLFEPTKIDIGVFKGHLLDICVFCAVKAQSGLTFVKHKASEVIGSSAIGDLLKKTAFAQPLKLPGIYFHTQPFSGQEQKINKIFESETACYALLKWLCLSKTACKLKIEHIECSRPPWGTAQMQIVLAPK